MTKISVNKNKLSVGTNPNSNCVEFNENGSGSNIITSVFGRTGDITAQSGDYDTSLVTEGSNLYFTQARAIASPLTGYVSGAGTVSPTDTILQAIQKLNGNIGALVTGVSSVSGTTNRIIASPTTGAVVIDISSSYVGQTSITTLGTITTGTWSGTTISIAKGGTNSTSQVNNGVNYFDGTSIKSLSTFLFDGTNLGIGAIPQSILTVSKQTTIQAPVSGSAAQFIGLDANPLRITFDTHNNANASGTALMFRRSRGTAGTPLALSSGDDLGSFNVRGYGTTGYAASSTGLLSFKANQTFTDANQGTYFSIFTTPDNSVTAAEVFRFGGSGQLGIGGATYGNANALFTSGGASAAPTWTNTGTGVLTFLTTPSWTNFNSMITGTSPNWLLASGGTLTGANTITGTTSNTLKFAFASLGTTQTDGAGIWLQNPTAATNGNQQRSPSIVQEGQGFATGGSTSQPVKFVQDVLPVQGTNAAAQWILRSSLNGGTMTNLLSATWDGSSTSINIGAAGTAFIGNNGANFIFQTTAGTERIRFIGSSISLNNSSVNAQLNVTQAAASSAWVPIARFDPGANTAMTASTPFPNIVVSTVTQTWVDGTVADQSSVWIKAPTWTGTTTLATFTLGTNLKVDAPIAGAKGSITTNNAIWSNGGLRASGTFTLDDTFNMVVGTSTGTKLGTATSQKLSIWNATPIVQPTTGIAAATFVANTSLIANDSATWDGYTAGQVVKALRNFGILA